jgi:hypothetical protein
VEIESELTFDVYNLNAFMTVGIMIVVWLVDDMNFKYYKFFSQAEGSWYWTIPFAPVSATWHP